MYEFCRFTLKQEEDKRRNADMFYEKIREQLRIKADQYSKEVEMKQQLELTLRALEMEVKTEKWSESDRAIFGEIFKFLTLFRQYYL